MKSKGDLRNPPNKWLAVMRLVRRRAVRRPILSFALLILCVAGTSAAMQAAKTASTAPTGQDLKNVNFPPFAPNMVYPVRIGIVRRESSARIACWEPGAVFIDFQPVFALRPEMIYQITPGRITEYATGRSIALPKDKRTRISSRDFQIWCNNRWYRGTLEVIHFSGSLTVINLLDMENYLMGVVPSEMPASWQLEALKAQAVAARSYASAHLGKGSKWVNSEGYDLVPDVRDQAYKGRAAEAMSSNMAIQQTVGIILKDSGRVKPGFYRATVGDAMENLNIRKKTVPDSVLEKLSGVKDILGVTVKQWDTNLNARAITVMGKRGARDIDGVELARRLGFTTAGILDVQEQGANWVFTYRGPGNGVRGLSQHGAQALAKNGWNFEQILRHYYQDPDGRLRLDYLDALRPRPVFVPVQQPPAAQQESEE